MLVENSSHLDQIRQAVSRSEILAIDTETNFTDSYRERYCIGVSIATDKEHFYIPVRHDPWDGIEFDNFTVPVDIFAGIENRPVVFHNAAFDLNVLESIGIKVPTENLWDTMLMSHYIDENNRGYLRGHGLDILSKRYLSDTKRMDLSKAMRSNWEHIPPYVMAKYAEADAYLTRDLYYVLVPLMTDRWNDLWKNYDREFMLLLKDLIALGVPIDRELCQSYDDQCQNRLAEIRNQLGFDPAKPSQLHPKLFGDPPLGLGLTVPSYTPGNKPQVKLDWLQSVGHPTTALIYEYKKIAKQMSSYFAPYLRATTRDYPRIHPQIKQHGTVTGRLSGDLQQLPRESYGGANPKDLFRPEEGKQLWEIDFRQIEYRLAVVYAQDTEILQALRNEEDTHQILADRMGVSRFSGKQLTYITIMGGGIPAVMKELKCNYPKAKEFLDNYWNATPKLADKIDECNTHAENNMEVNLWTGRTRHFMHKSETRKAFNSVIQGGAFEIVKRSMLQLRKAGVQMSNQVHDSAWINVDSEAEAIEAQKIMEDWTEEPFGLRFSTDRKLLYK